MPEPGAQDGRGPTERLAPRSWLRFSTPQPPGTAVAQRGSTSAPKWRMRKFKMAANWNPLFRLPPSSPDSAWCRVKSVVDRFTQPQQQLRRKIMRISPRYPLSTGRYAYRRVCTVLHSLGVWEQHTFARGKRISAAILTVILSLLVKSCAKGVLTR